MEAPGRTIRQACTILVVDDHADSAVALSRLLKRSGHSVETAGSVAEAVALAERQRFDLLLCDLSLPDGDGCDLLRQLLASGAGATIKGIAVTGHVYPADEARTKAAGFVHHVAKPVDLPALSRFIEELC